MRSADDDAGRTRLGSACRQLGDDLGRCNSNDGALSPTCRPPKPALSTHDSSTLWGTRGTAQLATY